MSWRNFDGMSRLQAVLYYLRFGRFMWFRRSVGGRWILRYWFAPPHSSDWSHCRWEYHPNPTFKGCIDTIEYWDEGATARAISQRSASIYAKIKDFIFSGFRVGRLWRLTRYGRRQRRLIRGGPSDVSLCLHDGEAGTGEPVLAFTNGQVLEDLSVYARRPDALGEFLVAYEDYLNGKITYEEIKAMRPK